jgi:protein-tyrosine-phosphatase
MESDELSRVYGSSPIYPIAVAGICRANIGRSQLFEAYWNSLRPGEALSFGTMVNEEEPFARLVGDSAVSSVVIQAMLEEGMDISGKIRTQITPERAAKLATVVIMAEPETVQPWLPQHQGAIIWDDIPDLKDQPIEFVREVRDEIKERVSKLVVERNSLIIPGES